MTKRPATFWDYLRRFAVRIQILVIVYLLPTLVEILGAPMREGVSTSIREVSAGGIFIATAVWISTQGRRRPENNGEN